MDKPNDRIKAQQAVAENAVAARIMTYAREVYEGNAKNLREQGESVPDWDGADVDDTLACIAAATESMRVTSGMMDTARAMASERRAAAS